MKRRKGWKVSKCTDMTVYNEKLARKLRKISHYVMRIAKRYGVEYVNLVVMEDYASVRAKEEHGSTATTVVDDYRFTYLQED